jgi:hypothetical protein
MLLLAGHVSRHNREQFQYFTNFTRSREDAKEFIFNFATLRLRVRQSRELLSLAFL